MASWMPITDWERDLLSQTIIRTLESWPDAHRRIFAEIHYRGRSVDSVAADLELPAAEVKTLLEDCERRLWSALRSFHPQAVAQMPAVLNRCA
jgi:DNA-directed RNA polymerase specialized sigma24 family protein